MIDRLELIVVVQNGACVFVQHSIVVVHLPPDIVVLVVLVKRGVRRCKERSRQRALVLVSRHTGGH